MELYKYKALSFGFIVISPEFNLGRLKSTTNSIKRNYPGASAICVLPKHAKAADLKEYKELCPTYKGNDTITSLINTGIDKGHKEWNLVIIEGSWMRQNIVPQFSKFVESTRDILFPISAEYDKAGKLARLNDNFVDGTINGILIHRDTFKEVGNFDNIQLEHSKILWAAKAIECGCRFKGVIGVKII